MLPPALQAPEIRNWVQELYQDKELVMGGYAYLDGELHVRLSIAMVAIMDGVIKGRDAAGYKSAGVAFLYVASCRVAGGGARGAE